MKSTILTATEFIKETFEAFKTEFGASIQYNEMRRIHNVYVQNSKNIPESILQRKLVKIYIDFSQKYKGHFLILGTDSEIDEDFVTRLIQKHPLAMCRCIIRNHNS